VVVVVLIIVVEVVMVVVVSSIGYDSVETNKMQTCNRIYYSTVR